MMALWGSHGGWWALGGGLLLGGCQAPPDAPEELEDLSAFLFEHLADEDPAALELGVDNLAAWLDDNLEALGKGYRVDKLSQASLDALEVDREIDRSALLGGAVGTASDHALPELLQALLFDDQTEVHPDDYALWESDFRTDPGCFVARTCDQLVVDNHSVTRLPFNLLLEVDNTAQYRWVESSRGVALLTRSWLHAPAVSTPEFFVLDEQFFLSVNVPTTHGLTRLSAVWADARIVVLEVSDGTALNLLVDALRTQNERLDEWLDER